MAENTTGTARTPYVSHAPRRFLGLLLLMALSGATSVHAGLYPEMKAPFTLWVESGQARATIVAKAPALGTAPAAELNGWLKRITGVELPVAETTPATGPRVFLGGSAAWERLGVDPKTLDLGDEGYLLRSAGDDLVVAGKTNLALLYGVYALVEHYLGCRWFWPGETGIVAPKQPVLRVGRIDESSRPDYAVRWIIRDRACARFNGGNTDLREPEDFGVWRFVHTYTALVEPARYAKEHPEFYAEVGGKRADPTRPRVQVNLCTTNPAVLDAVVRKIDEILAETPGTDMVSVDPMDTQVFCQCAACRSLQDPAAPYEARASRLAFDFTNRVAEQVAKKHPGLLIKTIAYHTYLAPPPFRMRDNVVIQFCRFMCHNHALDDPACPENAYFNRQILAWRSVCARLMMYEYYSKESWCGLPWPIVHTLRRDIPYLRGLGVTGVASQWKGNHANNGLGFYVAMKLLWNSKLDVDALLADFYGKAYAEAAMPMRRYHERLESAMAHSGLHVAAQRGYRAMNRFLAPELQAALAADLDEARKVVRYPGAAQRVELTGRGFRYATLVAAYLREIAARVEGEGQPAWRFAGIRDLPELQAAWAPRVAAIREFLADQANAGASPGLGSYEEALLVPKAVAGAWFMEGDRQEGARRMAKTEWLREHPQKLSPTPPKSLALWVYGNDLDWVRDTGPEHVVSAAGRDGKERLLGRVGREDRPGDGTNLAFVLRGIDPAALDSKRVRVTIENPPGGPYGSTLFALYLVPDDGTPEDGATRLIERDPEAVRRRAAAFVEYGFSGTPVNEGEPLRAELEIAGYPE